MATVVDYFIRLRTSTGQVLDFAIQQSMAIESWRLCVPDNSKPQQGKPTSQCNVALHESVSDGGDIGKVDGGVDAHQQHAVHLSSLCVLLHIPTDRHNISRTDLIDNKKKGTHLVH